MADCKTCGTKLTLFGRCSACDEAEVVKSQKKRDAIQKEKLEAKRKVKDEKIAHQQALETIVVTTEVASNLNVISRVDVVMAAVDCAFDVKMLENKDTLLAELRSAAYSVGANAVVGVVFNTVESYSASIGVGNFKTFKLIAYGTAVRVE